MSIKLDDNVTCLLCVVSKDLANKHKKWIEIISGVHGLVQESSTSTVNPENLSGSPSQTTSTRSTKNWSVHVGGTVAITVATVMSIVYSGAMAAVTIWAPLALVRASSRMPKALQKGMSKA